MPARRGPTEAAVAETAAGADVRAATGPRSTAAGGPGSSDPLLAGLRKAGLLRLLVLHLLGPSPSYGNQLMERVGELTGGLVAVNPNTMYPLLRALEADGLVAGEWEHPERRSRRVFPLAQGRGGRRGPPGARDGPPPGDPPGGGHPLRPRPPG